MALTLPRFSDLESFGDSSVSDLSSASKSDVESNNVSDASARDHSSVVSVRSASSGTESVVSTASDPSDVENKLEDTWVLWFHEMGSTDWSKGSYRQLYEFNTVEGFWALYVNLPSVINGMWFVMRKTRDGEPIYPMWEDPANIHGGAWLFKIHKKDADSVWLDMSLRLVGETLCKDSIEITGLSISPKKNFVTIRVWNRNSKWQDTSVFPRNIPHIKFEEAIYKNYGE